MEKKGKAGSYIMLFKNVILPWSSYNNIGAKLKVNVKGASETPTIAIDRVPSKDEPSRILMMVSSKRRVSTVMMAFSGLRPSRQFWGRRTVSARTLIKLGRTQQLTHTRIR